MVSSRPSTYYTYDAYLYWDFFGCGNSVASTRIYTPTQLAFTVAGITRTGSSGSNNLLTTSFSTWVGAGVESLFSSVGGVRGTVRFCDSSPVLFSTSSTITNSGCSTVSAATTRFVFTCTTAGVLGVGKVQLNITNVQSPMSTGTPSIPGYCLMIHLTSQSTSGVPVTVATSLSAAIVASMQTMTYSYSPSSLVLTPVSTDYTQVVSTFSGTFNIEAGETLTTSSSLTFTTALTSFDFSSTTATSGCTVASAASNQLVIRPTATTTSGSYIYCALANMRVVFDNAASRVSSVDPYNISKAALKLTSPSITSGISASSDLTIRASGTAAYWWHMTPINRVLVQGLVLATTRLLQVNMRIYFYATNPGGSAISYTVSSSCSDISIVTNSSSVTPSGDYRVTQGTATSITFDVTNSTRYSLDLSCFSMGSITQAIGAVQAISAYSRQLDFVFYPVSASLSSGIDLSVTTHDSASVALVYEVIVFAHTALASSWGFTLTMQSDIATRAVITTSTAAITSYTAGTGLTKVTCTVSRSSATVASVSGCGAVSASSANYYAPRVFRFGPVTTTYADYLSMFKTYSTAQGALGTVSGVSVPQQNTDMSDDTISASDSPPSAVAALYLTRVTTATVTGANTTAPAVTGSSVQNYFVRVFFFKRISSVTVTYSYSASSEMTSSSSVGLSSSCSSFAKGSVKCSSSLTPAMYVSFYTGLFTIAYEKTSFTASEFSFTIATTYATAATVSTTVSAFAGSSLGAPLTYSPPFEFTTVLTEIAWASTDLTAKIHFYLFPHTSVLSAYNVVLQSNCGVFTTGKTVTLVNSLATGTCASRYSSGFDQMSMPATCMPAQPKFVGFQIEAAYTMSAVHKTAYAATSLVPASCFTLVDASTSTALTTLHSVDIGPIPPPNAFMYDVSMVRSSSSSLQHARADIRTVLMVPISATSVKVIVTVSNSTAGNCPAGLTVTSTTFYTLGSSCTRTSASGSELVATCTGGPWGNKDVFAFGFDYINFPTTVNNIEETPYLGPGCISVKMAYDAFTLTGIPMTPVWSRPLLTAELERTLSSDATQGATHHLSLDLGDEKFVATTNDFSFIALLRDFSGLTFYSHTGFVTTSKIDWKVASPASGAVEFGPSAPTSAVGVCLPTAPCTVRIPVTATFAGTVPLFTSVSVYVKETSTGLTRPYATAPVRTPAGIIQQQLAPPAMPFSATAFTVTATAASPLLRTFSITLFDTTTLNTAALQYWVVQLPLTGFTYASAKYTLKVGAGSASTAVSVPAEGEITIPKISTMVNVSVVMTVTSVTVTLVETPELVTVALEHYSMRNTLTANATRLNRAVSLGYGALQQDTRATYTISSNTFAAGLRPVYATADCAMVLTETRYRMKCSVAWTGLVDITPSMTLALVTRDASPHTTPTGVRLESATRTSPTLGSTPCTPATTGAAIALTNCLANGYSALTLEVIISAVSFLVEQQLEIELRSGTARRAVAQVRPPLGVIELTGVDPVFTFASPTSHNGLLVMKPVLSYYANTISSALYAEVEILGGRFGTRFVAGASKTTTSVTFNSCAVECEPINVIFPNISTSLLCPISSCSLPASGQLTVSVTSGFVPGPTTEERAMLRLSITATVVGPGDRRVLYSGLFTAPRGTLTGGDTSTGTDTVTAGTVARTAVHTLTPAPTLCSGGDIVLDSGEYFRLTPPLSARTNMAWEALAAAQYTWSSPDLAASGTTAVSLTATVSSKQRWIILRPQTEGRAYCFGARQPNLIATLPIVIPVIASESFIVEILSRGGLVRYRHLARLSSLPDTELPAVLTLSTRAQGDYSAVGYVKINITDLTVAQVNEARFSLTMGSACNYFPAVGTKTLGFSDNVVLVSNPSSASLYKTPVVDALEFSITATAIPVVAYVPGVYCSSSADTAVTLATHFGTSAAVVMSKTATLPVAAPIPATQIALYAMHLNGKFATVAGAMRPPVEGIAGYAFSDKFDISFAIISSLGIPAGYYLSLIVPWVTTATFSVSVLDSAHTTITNVVQTLVPAERRVSLQFTKGWPANSQMIIVRSGSSVDSTVTSREVTAKITMNLDSMTNNILEQGTSIVPLRSDWYQALTSSVTVVPTALGSGYARGVSLTVNFRAPAATFIAVSPNPLSVLLVLFPTITVASDPVHESAKFFFSNAGSTTLQCGTLAVKTLATSRKFERYASALSADGTTVTYAPGFRIELEYQAAAVNDNCVLTVTHLHASNVYYRDALTLVTTATVTLLSGASATVLNNFYYSTATAAVTTTGLLKTNELPTPWAQILPLAPLSMNSTSSLRFLSAGNELSVMGPQAFFYTASTTVSNDPGFAGLGDVFSLALRLQIKTVPTSATAMCFSLPVGTNSSATTITLYIEGQSTSSPTSIAANATVCPSGLRDVLASFDAISFTANTAARSDAQRAVLPTQCVCTNTAALPTTLKQADSVMTIVIPGVSFMPSLPAEAIESLRMSPLTMIAPVANVEGTMEAVVAPAMTIGAIPPRNRIFPRGFHIGNPLTPFTDLAQVTAAAAAPSMSLMYAVASDGLYVAEPTVSVSATTPTPYVSPQISTLAAWKKIASVASGRVSLAVAPDDTTVVLNSDNKQLTIIETSYDDTISTATIPFSSIDKQPLYPYRNAHQAPLFTPIILGWQERTSFTASAATATVVLPVGGALHVFSFTAEGQSKFLRTEYPIGENSTITAVASSATALAFVVCGSIPNAAGAQCVTVKQALGAVTFTTSARITIDSRVGVVVTAADLCPAGYNGLALDACFFAAVQNTDAEAPASTIYRISLGSTIAVTRAAVVPGIQVVDLKLTSFANQIILLRNNPNLIPLSSVAIAVLSRISDSWMYEAGGDLSSIFLTLPSTSTVPSQRNLPMLVASADRESFIVAAGNAAQWRSFKALPVLNNVVALSPTSSAITVQFSRASTSHKVLFASNTFTLTLTLTGSLYNGSTLIQTLRSSSGVNDVSVSLPLTTAAPWYVADSLSPYSAALAFGVHPASTGVKDVELSSHLRMVTMLPNIAGFIATSDVMLPEKTWFGGVVPTLVGSYIADPMFGRGKTTTWRVWFTSPDALHTAATWTLALRYATVAQQTAVIRATNANWTLSVTCTPGFVGKVSCAASASAVTNVATGTPLLLRLDLEVTLIASADLLTTSSTGSNPYSLMTMTRGALTVPTQPYSYVRPAVNPAGYFGYSHRAPLGAHLPSRGPGQVSWYANSEDALCYTFARDFSGCYRFTHRSNVITGDWIATRNTAAAPDPAMASAYGPQGTLVSLVTATRTGSKVSAMRFTAPDPTTGPLAANVLQSFVDLPFDSNMFYFRLGASGVAHMYVVSSAELTGGLVIVYNDAYEVVMLVRMNPRTMRASGTDNVLTSELYKRMDTPIQFSGNAVGDRIVATFDWTAPTSLTNTSQPTTRVVFVYASGLMRACVANIRESSAAANRATASFTADTVRFSCAQADGASTYWVTNSDGTVLTPTSAAFAVSDGVAYIGTEQNVIVAVKLSSSTGVVTITVNHVPSLSTVCPIAALAVHPSGRVISLACADSGTLVNVRVLHGEDLTRYILRANQTAGCMVHVSAEPSRDLTQADRINLHSESIDAYRYFTYDAGLRSVVSMAYAPHGTHLAVMGTTSVSTSNTVQFLRMAEEMTTTFSPSKLGGGVLANWTFTFAFESFAYPTLPVCTVWGPQSTSFANVTSVTITTTPATTTRTVTAITQLAHKLTFVGTAAMTATSGTWEVIVLNVINPIMNVTQEFQASIACSHQVTPQDPGNTLWSADNMAPVWNGPVLPTGLQTVAVTSVPTPITADSYPWSLTLMTLASGSPVSLTYLPPFSRSPLALQDAVKIGKSQVYRVRVRFQDGSAAPCVVGEGNAAVVTIASRTGISTTFMLSCSAATTYDNPIVVELTPWVGTLASGYAAALSTTLTKPVRVTPTYYLTATVRVGSTVNTEPESYPAGADTDVILHFNVPMTEDTSYTLSFSTTSGTCRFYNAVTGDGPTTKLIGSIALPGDLERIDDNGIVIGRMRCSVPYSPGVTINMVIPSDKGFVGDTMPVRPIVGTVFVRPTMTYALEFSIGANNPPIELAVLAQPAFSTRSAVKMELLRNGLPLSVPCSLLASSSSTAAKVRTLTVQLTSTTYAAINCYESVAPTDNIALSVTYPNNDGSYDVITTNYITAWLISTVRMLTVMPTGVETPTSLPIFTPFYIEFDTEVRVERYTTNIFQHSAGGDACAFAPVSSLTKLLHIKNDDEYRALITEGVLSEQMTDRVNLISTNTQRHALLAICSTAAVAVGTSIDFTLTRVGDSYIYPARLSHHASVVQVLFTPKAAVYDAARTPNTLGETPMSEVAPHEYFIDTLPLSLTLEWVLPTERANSVTVSVYMLDSAPCYFNDNINATSVSTTLLPEDAESGSLVFTVVCTVMRYSEQFATRITDDSTGAVIAQWTALQVRITGRITLTAALPALDTADASTIDLTESTSVVEFPRAVTVPMTLTFRPALVDSGVFGLSFTNPSANCVFKASSTSAADTDTKDFSLAVGVEQVTFSITCAQPASDPPRISALFTEDSKVYYDRFESSGLQTKGELQLMINNKTTASYLSFVVRETYTIIGQFVPTPTVLQSVSITQITTPADCVFLLNNGATLYTSEPVFKQTSLTEPFYARMICRRTHGVGSIFSITSDVYTGETIGPTPVWGLIGMDFFVPTNIVGANREITDLTSRELFSTEAVASGADELPAPYILRAPATNTTQVRVRVIPSVLAMTIVYVTFTKTNGLCGFTTYSDSGIVTFAYTAQLTYAVGDAQKDIYVSCSVTNSEPVYLHAELAAGNYLLPAISLPLKVRGSIKFTTDGVEPRMAFNGDLVANRDWRFTVSLDPVAAEITTLAIDVLPNNATGPNPSCGFRLITGELADEHLTYGAYAFNFTYTMTSLDLIINCRIMTEINPSVVTITNNANNWYDRFITAPFRVRGAMWLEDAALPPATTYPTSSTITLNRVAVQNIHKFNLRMLPAPVAATPIRISVSDTACTFGLETNTLPGTFTAALSLSVPIGVETITLHLYCTQPNENVTLTAAPTGQSFLGTYVTNPFPVENRFNMATLPTEIHVLEPTLLTFTLLPTEAITGVGQSVRVNITVDSNFTTCYGAPLNTATGGLPESNTWQPLFTTGLDLTAVRTTSRSFWFKCLVYTHPLGADPVEGFVLPRINITRLSGIAFMSYLSAPIKITLIDCKAMSAINHGTVTYEDKGFGLTHYTAEASVVCGFGYSLSTVGQPNVTCTYNTASSPPVANCVQRMTCLASGWSSSPPACEVFNCGAVPASFPDFGTQPVRVQAAPEGNATAYGSRYEYGCVEGFALAASGIVTCTAGGWTVSSAPKCLPLECQSLALANNVGEINYSELPHGERKYQSTATHVCLDQYERTSGDLQRVCRANQTWSGTAPICRSNTCIRIYTDNASMKPVTFTRLGVSISYNTTTNAYPTDTIATYECADGYMWTTDSGAKTRTCVIAEGWLPVDAPRCVPRPCPTLTEVSLGTVTQAPSALMNVYGVTATYSCEYGAVMSHAAPSITCTATGEWSSSPRTCSPYNCGVPTNINGATIVVANNGNHGPYLNTSWVEYRCNSGYNLRYTGYNISDGTGYVVEITQSNTLVLAARRECTPRGWFPLAAPQCQVNQCEDLFVPANGAAISYRDALNTGNNGGIPRSYGTIATYSCQPGYETRDALTDVIVASTRRCGTLAEGWVPAVAPACGAVDCGYLGLSGPIKYGLPATYSYDHLYVSGPTRFQSHAVYKCQSGFVFTDGSSVFERRCAETGAWLPAEPSCQDIDECDPTFFNGRYYIDCAALYGSQSKCINTFGSYVCTPFITIEDPPVNVPSAYGYIAYNSDTREVVPDNAKGGQTVQFTLRAGANVVAPYITRVQYTNPDQNLFSNPELLTYECTNPVVTLVPDSSANATSGSNSFIKVTCALSAGQGGDLYLRMQFCVQRNSATNLAADIDCSTWNWNWTGTEALDDLAHIGENNRVRVSYPRHYFLPSSLHTITVAGPGQRTNDYVSMTTLGEDIGFEIPNLFIERKEILTIRYGLASSATDFPFECVFNYELSTYQATPNILVCRTKDNVNLVDLYFKLTIAGRSVYSTDKYSYPQVPTVESVYGCPVDDITLGKTGSCPTDGGDVRLTVTGTGFLEPLSVMVSGRQCTSIEKASNELLTCKLPSGSGSSLALIVKAGSQRTESRDRVTYAIPVITEIRGCEQVSISVIKECNRLGGNRIMLRGDNFGGSGATISIGGLTCTNVTHTALDPHREVLCTTPADSSVDRAVTLLQRYGDISRETILLSYVQCPPGQRNDDYRCVPCEPGYYNDLWSQALCRQCQPGYYSNSSGAANCSPCPTGTYSGLGYQTCVRCPRGTFAQERAESCMQCAPGTYAADEGSAQCEACPLGAEHTSDYSYCQCKAGSYKDAHGVCQTCMLGGDCIEAGTTVYNVMSLDYYSPSVTFRNLTSVIRFSFPVCVSANVPADDARRNALALAVKALFDDTDRPRGRFVFVSTELQSTTAANNSALHSTANVVASSTGNLTSVYTIIVDVVPQEHDNEESASSLVAAAVGHLSSSNSVLSSELAYVSEPIVDKSYSRHAITSFEYCLSNTCQPGSVCAEGHTGPLCSVCLPGYGKDSVFKCGRCNDPALAYFILIASGLAAIIGCGILAWKQIMDGKQSMNELPAPAVPLLFKVAMAGLQVMSIASRYDLKWPGFLDGMFDGADTAAGVGTAMLSLDCFLGDNPSVKPFWVTSIGIMALPMLGIILPLLFFAPRYYTVKRGYKKLVLAEIAEQRRMMVEIVTEYEDFRRRRDKLTVVHDRAVQRVQDEQALKVGIWDHVEDEHDDGILAYRKTEVTHGIENDIHTGIDLDFKQSAQSELELARKTVGTRRKRRVFKARPQSTEAEQYARSAMEANRIEASSLATDSTSGEPRPLAPPEQPPMPLPSSRRHASFTNATTLPGANGAGVPAALLAAAKGSSAAFGPVSTPTGLAFDGSTTRAANGSGRILRASTFIPPPSHLKKHNALPDRHGSPDFDSVNSRGSFSMLELGVNASAAAEPYNAFFGAADDTRMRSLSGAPRYSLDADIIRQQLVDHVSLGRNPTVMPLEGSCVVAHMGHFARASSPVSTPSPSPMIKPYQFDVNSPRNSLSIGSPATVPGSVHGSNGTESVSGARDGSDSQPVEHDDTGPVHLIFENNDFVDDHDSDSDSDYTNNIKDCNTSDLDPRKAAKARRLAAIIARRDATMSHDDDLFLDDINGIVDTAQQTNSIAAVTSSALSGHEIDDTAFTFQRDIIGDTNVTESALETAFALANESRQTIFERTAREVELYGNIVKSIDIFDDDKRARDEASAFTTEEFARVVQSEEDLENMRLLSRLPFDKLYDAELLRERVLRRERAFQRVRADAQSSWYVQNYGERNGKVLFEKERAKRLKAEPPKLTAAEMRVRVSVAESLYNQIMSEFSGYVITTITVVMFMIHPNITRQFFTILSCKNVGGTVDPSAKVVLGEMMETCYSSQHILFIVALGMPMLVLWVLGIPFFAWFVLYRNRDLVMMPAQGASATMRSQKKIFESQMAFMYRGYKPTRYYWFLMEMARKAILVAISVFFPGALHTQLLLASLLIFVCIIAQIAAKPFENKIPEFVELFSLFTSFMVFFLANFLFVSTVSDTAQIVVTVLICMLVVMFIAIVVFAFFMLSKEEAELTPLRNALREAHAHGQETGPVVRAWRIEIARLRKGRAGENNPDSDNVISTGATETTSVFTLTADGTGKLQSDAVMMRAIHEDACAAVSAAAVKSQLSGVGDGVVDDPSMSKDAVAIMTDVQRGARFALLLEQGHDITTTGIAATISFTVSADEVAAAVISEAKRHAQAQAKIAGDKLDVDLTPIEHGDLEF